MFTTAQATALVGLDAHKVLVEVQSTPGPAEFKIIGLAEASVRESRVRIRSALYQLGVDLGEHHVTATLVPAELKKTGGSFDLAIATATLAALGQVPADGLASTMLLGELSLTGALRPMRGVLPLLMGARRAGVRHAIVPTANGPEAAAVDGIEVFVADSLEQVRDHLQGKQLLSMACVATYRPEHAPGADLSEIKGQHAARRALEIAAAGAHHILMIGPPGSGKTMLARRLPTILPALTHEEALEVSVIHSVAGILDPAFGLLRQRPFRAPHHTVSDAGLVGGGDPPRPGEISLAHLGVLFLDELAEFRRSALEALRKPMEDGVVTIARGHVRATFPARPLVVAAVNRCPCGWADDPSGRCRCGPDRVRAYRARLSGSLLDRIDVHVELPQVEAASLRHAAAAGESSASVRQRVMRARDAQRERAQRGEVSASVNALLSLREIDRVAVPDEAGARILAGVAETHGLRHGKVLRVARTIADLDRSDGVRACHVAEAISLRHWDTVGSRQRSA